MNPNRVRKSIGAERFAEDLEALDPMIAALEKLAADVVNRMNRHQRYGYTLTLKVKYADYQQMTRTQTVNYLLREQNPLFELAATLLRSHLDRSRSVRLLGLTVSNLAERETSSRYRQLCLELS